MFGKWIGAWQQETHEQSRDEQIPLHPQQSIPIITSVGGMVDNTITFELELIGQTCK